DLLRCEAAHVGDQLLPVLHVRVVRLVCAEEAPYLLERSGRFGRIDLDVDREGLRVAGRLGRLRREPGGQGQRDRGAEQPVNSFYAQSTAGFRLPPEGGTHRDLGHESESTKSCSE